MEETYNLTAIILNRRPFGEDDGRVCLYSRERGKLELVARGLKKIKSKLAGHLEPLTLANMMAVRGRQYDYVGAAVSQKCFGQIKTDLAKLEIAGQAVNVFNKLVKAGQADEKLFILLEDFLRLLDGSRLSAEILLHVFILKLLTELGYRPELYHCVICHKKIEPDGNKFDSARGGVICGHCRPAAKSIIQLTISADSIKVLRLANKEKLEKIAMVKLDKKVASEITNIISSFLKYNC